MTNLFEIYIIELPKCKNKNTENNNLIKWIEFLKNPENLGENDMNEEIKEAKECLEKISKDEEEIRWAELREKYVLEINTAKEEAKEEAREEGREEGIKEGREEGIKEGREKGIREGREEGEKKTKREIAKKMLNLKVDIETISNLTDLTKEEIQNL